MVSRHRNHFAALGIAALMAGAALYAVDRPALPPGVLRAVLGSAPSFLHTMAFTLLTLRLLPGPPAGPWAAAALWCVLNGGVELLQVPSLRIALPGALARHWAGTFDPMDLVAVVLGAAVAAALAARRP